MGISDEVGLVYPKKTACVLGLRHILFFIHFCYFSAFPFSFLSLSCHFSIIPFSSPFISLLSLYCHFLFFIRPSLSCSFISFPLLFSFFKFLRLFYIFCVLFIYIWSATRFFICAVLPRQSRFFSFYFSFRLFPFLF